jgi:diacylglycerol O-acyltransferase
MPRQLPVNGKAHANGTAHTNGKPLVLKSRLSPVDAAFLYLERKEIPLAIASIGIFDGPIPFEKFVANLEARLDLLPRYRQIAVPPPLNLGHPVWEDYPQFDIRRHVFRVRLPAPGSDAQLQELAGRILSQVMDRRKPLWDVHLVEGLTGGRGALILRVHHSLADGVAGAGILKIILDPSPEGPVPLPKPRRTRPKHTSPATHSLADAIGEALYSTLQSLIAAEACVLSMGQVLFSERAQKGLEGLSSLLPELAASSQRLPFNKPCGGERKISWAEADFACVKAIREALGGTVNDVILTIVSRAIARYVRLHGESVEGRFARIVCPVSVRQDGGESMGNQISFLPVALPLGVRDPARNLAAVSRRTEIMKSAHTADLVALLASWIGATPPAVQAMFWSAIPLVPLPVPLLNLICTNVPGSPVPLYSCGRRMLTSYPYVPTGYELGIGIAVQSYAGKLFFGFTADAKIVPDVDRLRQFVEDAFRQLCKAAGVKKRVPRKPRPASKPEPKPAVVGSVVE